MPAKTKTSPVAGARRRHRRSAKMSAEEREIFKNLQTLGSQLSLLHEQYDYLTDPALIDGCIYEIKSVQMKYKYYIHLCRERGLLQDCAGII